MFALAAKLRHIGFGVHGAGHQKNEDKHLRNFMPFLASTILPTFLANMISSYICVTKNFAVC